MTKTGILVINEQSFMIHDGLTFIGRDPVSCAIILTNVTISKQHALVIKIKDTFYVSDLQSTNGTKLEEVLLTPRVCYEIIDNAAITLGDVKCKFIIQDYDAIFKTPSALSKKLSTKTSLNVTTKLVSTNIHDLPTQLEDAFEDSTQQLHNRSTDVTQILESSIIETQNIAKITPRISNKFRTSKEKPDDFVIPETQTENFCNETQTNFEIDESNNSEQLELSNLDISDTQMVEIHNSMIESTSKPQKHKQLSKDVSSKNIHELETQYFDDDKLETLNTPIRNLESTSNTSMKTLNIYDMETQLCDNDIIYSPKENSHKTETQSKQGKKYSSSLSWKKNTKPSSPLSKNIYEAETQFINSQEQTSPNERDSLNEHKKKPSSPLSRRTITKPSSPLCTNIYEAETQLPNSQEEVSHKIPSIKVTSATDSDLTSSNNSLEDRIDHEMIADSGEPHIENDLAETQFEYDAEPHIETPKLMQFDENNEKKINESQITPIKRVIGKNRPITFTEDNSQLTESQSEPEMPGMKKRIIGYSKPVNFTQSQVEETQFDIMTKQSPILSSCFSDSDSSLNSSVKSNIRNIIQSFEAASKNCANTSTPNRTIEERPREFNHKITRSVETEITGIPKQVSNDVVVELETSSVTNCLNDNISNTSVQHKAYYTLKKDVPAQINQNLVSDTSKSVPDTPHIFKRPSMATPLSENNSYDDIFDQTTLVIDNFIENDVSARNNSLNSSIKVPSADDDTFNDSTQIILPEIEERNSPSSNTKQSTSNFKKLTKNNSPNSSTEIPLADNDIFDDSTQIILPEIDEKNSPSSNTKQSTSTFRKPTKNNSPNSSIEIPLTDNIFVQPTQVMLPESETKISPSSNTKQSTSTFKKPTKNNSPNSSTEIPLADNIFDQPTQVMLPESETKNVSSTNTKQSTLTFQKSNLIVSETQANVDDDNIFDISTQVIVPEQVSKANLTETTDSIFCAPTQISLTNINKKNFANTSSSDVEVFDMATQVIEKPSNNQVQTGEDVFDMPTQTISFKKTENVSKPLEMNNIFDVPTQTIETIKDNTKSENDLTPEKLLHDEDLDEMLKNVSKASEIDNETSSSTDDLSSNTRPRRHTRRMSEKAPRKLINRKMDSEDIKRNHQRSSSNQSTSAKESDHDSDKVGKLTKVDIEKLNKSGKIDGTKQNQRSSSNQSTSAKESDHSTDKVSKSTKIDIEKLNQSEKIDGEDTKRNQRSSGNQSTSAKESDHDTEKVGKSTKIDVEKSNKSAKIDGEDTKRKQRSSCNQSTSAKESVHDTDKVDKSTKMDVGNTKNRHHSSSSNKKARVLDSDQIITDKMNTDKAKYTRKAKQNKTKDNHENSNIPETKTKTDSSKNTQEQIKMIVTTTKQVISVSHNDGSKSTAGPSGESSSTNRSTRSSLKRADTATETNLEVKKRKTSNNKQKLIEENKNTNNERILQKQKSQENIKLKRTNATNDGNGDLSSNSRPTRKTKIPIKFQSSPEDSHATGSNRKRGHAQSTLKTSSEGSVESVSSKVMKLDVDYVPTKEKFRVMFTIFRDEEQEQTVKKLGGKVVEKSKDANVLVTNQIKRSVKLLNAISQGIPIVSPRWLDICKVAKTFVDPWQFLLEDLESEKKFKFQLRESLNIAKQNGLLLRGYTALITKSVPTDLKDILENAGAKYITTWPKNPTDKHIIVSSMEDKSQWVKQSKGIIVAAEAIFSSVTRQKLDLKSYLLI